MRKFLQKAFRILLLADFEENIFYIFTLKKRISLSFSPEQIRALNTLLFYFAILEKIKYEKSKIDLIFTSKNKKLRAFEGSLHRAEASQRARLPEPRTPDSKSKSARPKQISLSELQLNKSIFSSITQSLNETQSNSDKVFSFSSDKKKTQKHKSAVNVGDDQGASERPETSLSRSQTVKNDSFTFNLIRKKIKDKTCEEPYKGVDLSDSKGANMKLKLLGEVNKFLWLIFHDLNLKGTARSLSEDQGPEADSLEVADLVRLVKELVEQLSLVIMDPHNVLYLLDTLLLFEATLYDRAACEYQAILAAIFQIIRRSLSNLLAAKLLLKALKQ